MRQYGPIVVACPALLLGYWGLGCGSSAWGAEEGPRARFHMSYRAPDGCPDEAEFAKQVGTNLGAPWLAQISDFAGILSVTVRGEGDSYAGHLVLVTADGGNGYQRRQAVEGCGELVTALAYSAAAAIEIIWRLPPPPPPPPSQPQSEDVQPHFEVGLDGGRAWGLGPSGAWGGSAFIGYRWPDSRVSARLGAEYWDSGWGTLAGVPLRASLIALNGDACPYELRVGAAVSIPLCVRVEIGVHSLRSQSAVGATSTISSGPWLSAGLLPRLRVSGWGAFMEVTGGLSFPFYRAEVHSRVNEDDPRPSLEYRAPAWAAVSSLGIGWEFL